MGRFIIGAFFGAIITVALGYLMQALIFADTELVGDVPPDYVITITREIIDEGPPERATPPVRPGEETDPPDLPPIEQLPGGGENPGNYPIPIHDPVPSGPTGIAVPMVLLPIVRVEPDYPRAALERGIEGYAVVSFSVGTDGATQNLRVTDSEPGTMFDNNAVRAVAGWIYQPQTDEQGNPVVVTGQSARFDFNLYQASEE